MNEKPSPAIHEISLTAPDNQLSIAQPPVPLAKELPTQEINKPLPFGNKTLFIAPRKKIRTEEPENHERWLVSYADFITLLFAFFVVMYAVSSVNEGKYRAVANSLDAAFHEPPRSAQPIQVGEVITTTPPPAIPLAQSRQFSPAQALDKITQEINDNLGDLIKKDILGMRRKKMWLEVEIKTSILFPSGSAVLESSALPALSELAAILRDVNNQIQVAGFTDDRPISSVLYRSNWELSAARAASVVHLFSKFGVKPERMSAIGYGEYRPVADNTTADGRNKNRRVVLQILAHPKGESELEAGN